MKNFKFVWLLQPLLIAIFPAMHLIGKNGGQIDSLSALFGISIIALSTTVLFFGASVAYKSYAKGALVANVLIILFYGSELLIKFVFVPISLSFYHFRVRYALVLLALATLYFLYAITNVRIKSTFFFRFAIVPFLLLNLFSFSLFAYKKLSFKNITKHLVLKENSSKTLLTKKAVTALKTVDYFPDIYFIILDAYTSDEALLNDFGYNNSWFSKKLASKGFTVLKNGKSSYTWTDASLYTTLNMDYLDEKAPSSIPYKKIFKHTNAKHFLEQLKYKYIPFGYGKEGTKRNVWGFFKTFLCMVTPFATSIMTNQGPKRRAILKQLNDLEQVIEKEKSPKFVYSHFMVPHGPHVFDVDGSECPGETKDETFKEWERKAYTLSVQFISRKIDHVIDQILKKSEKPPIIILQGDHGAHIARNQLDRNKILSAFYLPSCPNKIPKNMLPVNQFRFIFNNYFGTNLPLLENRYYRAPKKGSEPAELIPQVELFHNSYPKVSS